MADMDKSLDNPLWSMSDLLSLEQTGTGKVDVLFRALPRLRNDGQAVDDGEDLVRILHVNVLDGLLTMFPTNNLIMPFNKVGPKYPRIERISFVGGEVVFEMGSESLEEDEVDGKFLGSYFGKTEPVSIPEGKLMPELEDTVPTSAGDVIGLLEGLPHYGVKDPRFGLGFKRQYRSVVRAIERLTQANEIRIAGNCSTAYEEQSKTFVLSVTDMLDLAKTIERVDRTTRTAANTVNETSTYNTIADVLRLPKRPLRYGRTELRKALTSVANQEKPLSHIEQVELVETLTKNAGTILKQTPAAMDGLESGIALARAKGLREDLARMMNENLSEGAWQRYLRGNPFVLSMIFGRPIVKVRDQASVGGRTISGGGDKIADFLVRNSLTNNAALVEIKTPKTKLLNQSPYRKSVFAPAGELVGAINQVLDQKSKFEQEIANIRYRNRSLDVEAHHVHACLLTGVLPSGVDRVRSFELFRHNLKDVVVVTFDELLRKVVDFCEFLEGKIEAENDDVPF